MTEESARAQYDRMTRTPVDRLVVTLGLPTTVSMLITNIYNMADTYFVSTLGTSASGATGVVFGLMAIIQAFGFMLGHGAGSNISRQLGGQHIENARKFASTSFYLSLLCGTVILALGTIFKTPLMRLLGSTDSILPYAKDYGTWILIAAPAMASSCVMNNILRYEGKAFYAMIGLTSGGILNIFGDWLLISKLGMGISGAGISTAVSQYVSAGILLAPYLSGKVQSRFSPKYITKDWKDVWNIVSVGMPSMMRQGLNKKRSGISAGASHPKPLPWPSWNPDRSAHCRSFVSAGDDSVSVRLFEKTSDGRRMKIDFPCQFIDASSICKALRNAAWVQIKRETIFRLGLLSIIRFLFEFFGVIIHSREKI